MNGGNILGMNARFIEGSRRMESLLDCLLIVGGSTMVAVLGMYFVRKKIPRQSLEACHEVGGYMLAIVGTLYAIVVGLIVVDSQAKVDEASHMAVTESNMLSNIYHLAHTFKQPAAHEIRRAVHDYAIEAYNQDWSKVDNGAENEATIRPYRTLWRHVTTYVPDNNADQQTYAAMIEDMQDLSEARKYRMVAGRTGLSPILWGVLITGGLLIILFTYFFFVESLLSNAIMTAFVAVFISMNVYLIYVCQNPYRHELGAKDAGFGFSFTPDWFNEPAHMENKR